jgi:predicted nucleotidyltransferase
MTIFTPAQLEDLREIQALCQAKGTEIVIIGAMAYRLFIHDVDRETRDIDLAVAIDHEGIEPFYGLLAGLGWERVPRHEQRWLTTRGTLMDVLPAGAALRSRGRMEWPESGLSMSLAGFDHVFRNSVTVSLGPGLQCKVVPPPVLALLKMASYADDPYGRAKDLVDLRRLLGRYERESDRLFCDAVFAAELPDIEFAGAFLLGVDVGAIATPDDRDIIARFLTHVHPRIDDAPASDFEGRDTAQFQQQIAAFRQGLDSAATHP